MKTLSSTYISDHKYFKARRDSYEMPSGKIVDPYFVVEIPNAAMAMAITEDEQVILVRQYRHAIGKMSIELPGGFIDPHEVRENAVARELLEETGYRFSKFDFLGTTYANPGVLSNATHMYIARGGVKTADQSLDGNEEIEILFKSIAEVRAILRRNEFLQSMHGLLLHYAFEFLASEK